MYMSQELHKLQELHQRGVLSDDEYARAKARLLDSPVTQWATAPCDLLTSLNKLRHIKTITS